VIPCGREFSSEALTTLSHHSPFMTYGFDSDEGSDRHKRARLGTTTRKIAENATLTIWRYISINFARTEYDLLLVMSVAVIVF
jgi:hypothetical protein